MVHKQTIMQYFLLSSPLQFFLSPFPLQYVYVILCYVYLGNIAWLIWFGISNLFVVLSLVHTNQ